MDRRIVALAAFLALAAGCTKYEVMFEHKRQEPPARVLVSAAFPVYSVWEWIEFKAGPPPEGGGWPGYKWTFLRSTKDKDGKETISEVVPEKIRYAQDKATGIELSHVVWVQFAQPGLYGAILAVQRFSSLRCTKQDCLTPLPDLPYRGGVALSCPRCKQLVTTPSVPYVFGSKALLGGGGFFVSNPDLFVVQRTSPRRFKYNDPARGTDLQLIKLFPGGGWVYVGEALKLSLHGVQVRMDTGMPEATSDIRITSQVQVDFGDGSKVEGYQNANVADGKFTADIDHQMLEHLYAENGAYTIRVTITDEQKKEYRIEQDVLVVHKPTSGLEKLVKSILAKLLNTEAGAALVGKDVIIYNLANQETYSDDNRIYPLEDQMVQEFHRAGIKVLERDEDVLRRWAPEVLGLLPNTFSRDLQLYSPEDLSKFADTLKIQSARPDFLIEYRIVELNERLEPHETFNKDINDWVDFQAIGTRQEGGETGTQMTQVQYFEAKWRKLSLKLYFRIIDGKSGPESTRVLFTDVMVGSVEDFIVLDARERARRRAEEHSLSLGAYAGAGAGGGQAGYPCPSCGAVNTFNQPVSSGQSVRCGRCGAKFNIR